LRERLPGVHVSLSHELTATFREYERAATTETDAALSPLLRKYLWRLREKCGPASLPEPEIMQSSGGLAALDEAASHAATTVLSGPAGGAAAATLLSEQLGERDLLCFDMGGTSCDVSVVTGGAVGRSGGRTVGERPIALPMIDIHTVGAGGGSIAWRDAGGALRVGPRSAGAEPGPACYGRGGAEPTVTDANLVLRRIPAALGDLELDADAAHRAVADLAVKLSLSVEECAAGIIRVADAEMVRALRVMTVERGLDARSYALLAFGGAGPLHACSIAQSLGIERIAVPHEAGVLSALGLAAADRRHESARTVMLDSFNDATLEQLAGGDEVVWEARYRGQSHELALEDVSPSAPALRAAFHEAHQQRYGYSDEAADVQLVTVRTARVKRGPQISLPEATGSRVTGPELIALPGCTLFVADGWTATDSGGAWRLKWTR
jgi:N-methylhydantoinase A/oxoprolinase/acetone carboxylase beta subunit